LIPFKIALLQIHPSKWFNDNLQKGVDACKKAKSLDADLALFPEMWNVSYDQTKMKKKFSIHEHDHFFKTYQELAKSLDMAIAITYLGMGEIKPTNNIAVIDHHGDVVLKYSKVHICNFKNGCETALEPGKRFSVCDLKFKNGTVKLGTMICFDREFPESSRSLMLQGAELIITPNACPLHDCKVLGNVRLSSFRTRAFENKVGVAMTNYPAPMHDGHSCAYNANGQEIIILNQQEQIAICAFDINFIRNWQESEPWGKASLHKKAYYTK
jgi:predicted amidohydrolase